MPLDDYSSDSCYYNGHDETIQSIDQRDLTIEDIISINSTLPHERSIAFDDSILDTSQAEAVDIETRAHDDTNVGYFGTVGDLNPRSQNSTFLSPSPRRPVLRASRRLALKPENMKPHQKFLLKSVSKEWNVNLSTNCKPWSPKIKSPVIKRSSKRKAENSLSPERIRLLSPRKPHEGRPGEPRPIVLDGMNIAYSFGSKNSRMPRNCRKKSLDMRGVELAYDFFKRQGHTQIYVVLAQKHKIATNRIHILVNKNSLDMVLVKNFSLNFFSSKK